MWTSNTTTTTTTEITRYTLVALSAYLGVLAWRCPCASIYSCHRPQALAAIAALAVIGAAAANSIL